jgi:MiaB/RimO family radical SAM methylthiotransferase
MKKKATIITNGCPENRIDAARIEQLLIQKGWNIEKNPTHSELILFNACGLTEYAQDESLEIIKWINKRKKKTSNLIVYGCLPKINREKIEEICGRGLFNVYDTHNIDNRLGIRDISDENNSNYLIPRTYFSKPITAKLVDSIKSPLFYKIKIRLLKKKYRELWNSANVIQPNTFYIKISTGCINSCSFCAVKNSRGTIRSKPIDLIRKEFLNGIKSGYNQFALIGTDTGSYGMDIQTNIVNLLKELISVEKEFKIKLRNLNPRALIEMLPEFMGVFKSGKISHITSAAQHGNDRILHLMKRGYKVGDFRYAINSIKNICPKLIIRTQLMVGFPGETASEFNDNIKLVDELGFDFTEVYKYSSRPNTPAASMGNKVSRKDALKRKYVLIQKVIDQAESSAQKNCADIGLQA